MSWDKRVAVVTGGTRGIGAAVALELARQGLSLVVVARDAARGSRTAEGLLRAGAPDAEFISADLSLVSEARRAADAIRARHPHLDLLINNAAGMFPKRTITAEGYEKTFALDYLVPMALTTALLPCLRAAPAARVVNVVSKAAARGRLDLDDLQQTHGYSGLSAYARAKLALMMGTMDLAEHNVALHINCIHPGMVNTGMPHELPGYFRAFLHLFGRFIATAEQGAARVLLLAVGEPGGQVSGAYFEKDRRARFPSAARDVGARRRLSKATDELLARSAPVEK